MRTKHIAAAGIAAVAALAGSLPAAEAAPKGAALKLTKVSKPATSVAAGDDLNLKATVKNKGTKKGSGAVRLYLTGGPSPYDQPKRVFRFSTGKIDPGAFKRFTVRVTVPTNTFPAKYRLKTCLKFKGAEKCKFSPRITVTGDATPTPTATPTAEPTTAPTATATATASPAPPTGLQLAQSVRDAVTVDGMLTHLRALQGIADDNGGNRAAGSPGYAASLQYVKGRLQDAGYQTTTQTFSFVAYEENAPSLVERTVPGPTTTIESGTLDYSASGDVTAQVQTVTPNFTPPRATGTDGCETADFANVNLTGKIALIQRGTCDVIDKVLNAKADGAIAMILFNAGDSAAPDRNGIPAITLGEDPGIPVVGISYADGEALGTAQPFPTVHVKTDTTLTPTTTANLIADTAGGNANRTVVVGSHLDSVPAGPGINDNGSGSAFNLELALQMAKLGVTPKNKVRFAWWGAEEAGLVGSLEYVDQLTLADAQKIAANLNFDMLGSPNFIRYVYDGDGSDNGGPDAAGPVYSDTIEKDFNDYFASQTLATAPTAFDGRSDYGPFIAIGIPAGGLFSGAEDEKTQEEASIFGGIPNTPFDPNYHEAGDTINNINRTGYEQLSKGAAYVSGLYAFERDLPAADIGRAALRSGSASGLEYRGNLAVR